MTLVCARCRHAQPSEDVKFCYNCGKELVPETRLRRRQEAYPDDEEEELVVSNLAARATIGPLKGFIAIMIAMAIALGLILVMGEDTSAPQPEGRQVIAQELAQTVNELTVDGCLVSLRGAGAAGEQQEQQMVESRQRAVAAAEAEGYVVAVVETPVAPDDPVAQRRADLTLVGSMVVLDCVIER